MKITPEFSSGKKRLGLQSKLPHRYSQQFRAPPLHARPLHFSQIVVAVSIRLGELTFF